MKSEKRKSSFPFAFGKKAEAGAASSEGEATSPDAEKKGNTPFSKLRATIKVCFASQFERFTWLLTLISTGQGQGC